jgi:hypothetical protein
MTRRTRPVRVPITDTEEWKRFDAPELRAVCRDLKHVRLLPTPARSSRGSFSPETRESNSLGSTRSVNVRP